jgi:hypothetical protein
MWQIIRLSTCIFSHKTNLMNHIICLNQTCGQRSLDFILQCWSKKVLISYPCVAKAMTIGWAINIAKSENLLDIWMERDAKICIDAIIGDALKIPWKINTLVSNIKDSALSFFACPLSWVSRFANFVARSLAKLHYLNLLVCIVTIQISLIQVMRFDLKILSCFSS